MFVVDWREHDDEIVAACERVLRTGDLTAEVVDDAASGFAMYIRNRERRERVPLVIGPADRHITLHVMNEMLRPAHEIRACVDSNGSDTLAFLPMSAGDWATLEGRHGKDAVARRFKPIAARPNLFTEPWSADVAPLARSWWRRLIGR